MEKAVVPAALGTPPDDLPILPWNGNLSSQPVWEKQTIMAMRAGVFGSSSGLAYWSVLCQNQFGLHSKFRFWWLSWPQETVFLLYLARMLSHSSLYP